MIRQNEPVPHGSVTGMNQSEVFDHERKEDQAALTSFRAAGVPYAGIITYAAVSAESGVESK